MSESQSDLFPAGALAPETLLNDRYRILQVVGRGGMGMVYRAEHTRLDTVVAVKEVYRTERDEAYQEALELCKQEAKMLVRLSHPNLPHVMDAFEEGGRFFLVMEYIEGETLEARIQQAHERPFQLAQVVEWALQLAHVLDYLHNQKPPIIFRDLKPANIMVRQEEGGVRLIDFGIARRFHPGASKDTALLGSVGYSPPEQFGKHQTDERSDIYSFGATLHHVLTLRDPAAQPFKFPPARSLNPFVPEPLSRLLERCLAIEANDRPQTIHEVAMALIPIRDELLERTEEMSAGNLAQGGALVETHSGAAPAIHEGERRPGGALANQPSRSYGEVATTDRMPVGSRIPALALLGAIGVIALGGGAVWMAKQKRVAPKPPVISSTPKPQTTPTVAPTLPTPAPTTNPASGQNPVEPPPSPQSRSVEFGRVEAMGVMADTQQNPWLRLEAEGKALNVGNRPGVLAVYFYDAAGNPIPARTFSSGQNPYANPNGNLSVSQSVQITEGEWKFSQQMDIPLIAFPPAAANTPIKIRCALFVEDKLLGDSGLKEVAFALPVPPAETQNALPGKDAPTGTSGQ